MKLAKREDDFLQVQNKINLVLNNFNLSILNLELQIAYKLYLGSEKDFEDVRYLYQEFKEKLDKNEPTNFVNKLKVKDKLIHLGGEYEK